jgi:integration host factor subunit alpha
VLTPSTIIKKKNTMTKTLTRADLSNFIYKQIGLSLQECNALVDSVIEEICVTLEHGTAVKLSSFGTFNLRKKKQRMGRNPKTGVEVPITSRTVLSFNASNLLKAKVNENLAGGKKKAI